MPHHCMDAWRGGAHTAAHGHGALACKPAAPSHRRTHLVWALSRRAIHLPRVPHTGHEYHLTHNDPTRRHRGLRPADLEVLLAPGAHDSIRCARPRGANRTPAVRSRRTPPHSALVRLEAPAGAPTRPPHRVPHTHWRRGSRPACIGSFCASAAATARPWRQRASASGQHRLDAAERCFRQFGRPSRRRGNAARDRPTGLLLPEAGEPLLSSTARSTGCGAARERPVWSVSC